MNILLSNDDGNHAIGSRLLVHTLKKLGHDLTVAGPDSQKSSVSASATPKGFTWKKYEENGVTYYDVTGTPNDALELLTSQDVSFDLIVSGVNWGANVGSMVYRSGTYCAAVAGIGLKLAPQGIAIGYDVSGTLWWQETTTLQLESVLSTPGLMVEYILTTALENNLWDAPILNISLPSNNTKEYVFVPLAKYEQDAYDMSWKPTDNTFKYIGGMQRNIVDKDTDIAVLLDGKIAITPTRYELTDRELIKKLRTN